MLYDEKRWSKQKVTEEKWRLILLRAADILEQKGWIRGTFHKNGHYCAMGAINKAVGKFPTNDDFDMPELKIAIRLLAHDVGNPDLCLSNEWYDRNAAGIIGNWNDDVAVSGTEVVARMRKVANEQ